MSTATAVDAQDHAHGHDEFANDVYEPTHDGVSMGKLALWLFLATEVMFFSGLIGAYLVCRINDPMAFKPAYLYHVFGGKLSIPLASLNTVILIFSSLTVVLSVHAAKTKDNAALRKWLFITLLCGFGFCIVKSIEYGLKLSHGIGPWTGPFYSFYFGMTGIHAIHVIAGIIPLTVILLKSKDGRLCQDGNNTVECFGLYWHFVDLAWIFLFPLLYMLR